MIYSFIIIEKYSVIPNQVFKNFNEGILLNIFKNRLTHDNKRQGVYSLPFFIILSFLPEMMEIFLGLCFMYKNFL